MTDVIQSIRVVAAGQHFISLQISSYLLNRTAHAERLAKRKPCRPRPSGAS